MHIYKKSQSSTPRDRQRVPETERHADKMRRQQIQRSEKLAVSPSPSEESHTHTPPPLLNKIDSAFYVRLVLTLANCLRLVHFDLRWTCKYVSKWNNSNEKVLHISQSSWTGVSPSNCIASYPSNSLGVGVLHLRIYVESQILKNFFRMRCNTVLTSVEILIF